MAGVLVPGWGLTRVRPTLAQQAYVVILCATCLIWVVLSALALPGLHTKADLSICGLGLSALPLPEYMGDGIAMAGENSSTPVREEERC